jgi:hypothetical protein
MLFDSITPDKIARPDVMKVVTAFVLPYVTRIRQGLLEPASSDKQIQAKTSKYEQITEVSCNAFPARNFCVGDAVFAVRGSSDASETLFPDGDIWLIFPQDALGRHHVRSGFERLGDPCRKANAAAARILCAPSRDCRGRSIDRQTSPSVPRNPSTEFESLNCLGGAPPF